MFHSVSVRAAFVKVVLLSGTLLSSSILRRFMSFPNRKKRENIWLREGEVALMIFEETLIISFLVSTHLTETWWGKECRTAACVSRICYCYICFLDSCHEYVQPLETSQKGPPDLRFPGAATLWSNFTIFHTITEHSLQAGPRLQCCNTSPSVTQPEWGRPQLRFWLVIFGSVRTLRGYHSGRGITRGSDCPRSKEVHRNDNSSYGKAIF